MYIALFLWLSQSGTLAADWIPITKVQVESARVVKLASMQGIKLDVCREVSFRSTGNDAISESSFTTVVQAVIDRSGRIQRFRIVMKPPIAVDITKPIQQALANWRYNIGATPPGEAFEIAIALPKVLGSSTTSACQKGKPVNPSEW